MVCEITPEMAERFLDETNDEFGLFVGMKGLPLDKLTAASERLAEIATRRLEDAIRKFSTKP